MTFLLRQSCCDMSSYRVPPGHFSTGLTARAASRNSFSGARSRPLARPIVDTIITNIIVFLNSRNILALFQGDGRDLFKNSTSAVLASETHPCGTKIAKVGEN